jgi:hypothetical protein
MSTGRCNERNGPYDDCDLVATAVCLGGRIIRCGGGNDGQGKMVHRLGAGFVVAPAVAVAVPVSVPVVTARRGAGAGARSGAIPAAAGARRRGRERRWRRQQSFRGEGLLVLGDVGLRVPVVEVAGGAVDQAAPRLRHRRVVRRVAWGRGSRHRYCRQIWNDIWSPARTGANSPAEARLRRVGGGRAAARTGDERGEGSSLFVSLCPR